MTKSRLTLLSAAAVAAVAVAALISAARANGATCTAYVGGLQSDKSSVPELVVFNPGGTPLSLTLTMRDAQGNVLTTPAAPLDVAGFNTAYVSLSSMLTTAGTAGAPYRGRFSLEVAGGPPFAQDSAVLHVTQYFGKPAKGAAKPLKPTSAFVVRPLFSPPL
jgi:hypothetical protein